jgi:hypothetical protein
MLTEWIRCCCSTQEIHLDNSVILSNSLDRISGYGYVAKHLRCENSSENDA